MTSIIAAASRNNVIGKDNKLPWRLPADLAHFKELTLGHTVILGRKTFESIGRPLPNRRNIVITRNKNFKPEGVEVVHSIEEALSLADDDNEVFVIGGEEIYKQALPLVDKVYLTKVQAEVDGDAYFPELGDEWKEVSKIENKADEENEYDYDFLEYIRSPSKFY